MKLLLVAMIVLLGSWNEPPGFSTTTPEELEVLVERVVIPAQSCEAWCISCPDPDEHALLADAGEFADSAGDWGHDCIDTPGGCEQHRCTGETLPEPVADLDPREAPEFWSALLAANGEQVRSFLRNNRDTAHYNAARRSLQVVGCGDRLIANIPLSKAQVSELEN